MVIVTRGRCRIDTLCQMLCRFHAQITQQQRHRLRASQTTGIAKCPQRNSSRTIKQRPGNDQALYAPARQRVKICSLCSPACTSRPRCVNAFSFQRQRAENHSYKAAICWGAPGKQSAGGDPFFAAAPDAARSASVPDDRDPASTPVFPPMSDAG